jgi:hypothetical protein
MTHQEADEILQAAVDRVSEHFDAVWIVGSWHTHADGTRMVNVGAGNIYTREAMVCDWLHRQESDVLARKIAESVNAIDDDN